MNRATTFLVTKANEVASTHFVKCGDEDEAVPVRSSRFDFFDHINAPHCEWPRSSHEIQRNWRYVHFISIDLAFMIGSRMLITIGFHSGPIISYP